MNRKSHCCTFTGCNSSFNRPSRLMQHLMVHENVKPFLCPETNCTKSYTSKTHLNRHINSVHKKMTNDVTYRCPECMKIYSNRQNLKRHLKSHKKLLSCDICKLTFMKKNALKSHIFTHTGVMPFSCKICLKEFKTYLDRKKHMKSHKTYSCDLCHVKFQHWSLFQKHRRAYHNTSEFICHDCGRKFNKRSYIVRHVKTHFDAIEVLQCPFVGCERTYTKKSNLKQHYQMKHDKKTHNCGICDAKLSTKAKLNNHILKIHSTDENSSKAKIQTKTLLSGRKERKDKGVLKSSTALKVAGLARMVELHA